MSEENEIQSGISQVTNMMLGELFHQIDEANILAARSPSVDNFKYIYDLLNRVNVKTHMLLHSTDHALVNKYKTAFHQAYYNIIDRQMDEDEEDETRPPTLREVYVLQDCCNKIESIIVKSLQKQKYFFLTKKEGWDNDYYDPIEDDVKTN